MMKGLSIRQPWVEAILHGDKRVENRDWAGCRYRGPILIHASKGCTRDEYESAVDSIGLMRADLSLPPMTIPPLAELPRGGFVGIARISDATRHPDEFADGADWSGYRIAGCLGLQLRDVRPLPFAEYAGQRGLFDVDPAPLPPEYRAAWVELGGTERAPGPAGGHTCHARECKVACPPTYLMCGRHWRMVPATIQREVWKHYREGQCVDKRPSAEWHRAADAAIGAVALLEGKTLTRAQALAAWDLGFRHERLDENRVAEIRKESAA